jgi:hypothetical protein
MRKKDTGLKISSFPFVVIRRIMIFLTVNCERKGRENKFLATMVSILEKFKYL